MLSGLFYLNSLDRSVSKWKDVRFVLLVPSFIEIPVLNSNSVYTDQTPRYVCKGPINEMLGIIGLRSIWKKKTGLIFYGKKQQKTNTNFRQQIKVTVS